MNLLGIFTTKLWITLMLVIGLNGFYNMKKCVLKKNKKECISRNIPVESKYQKEIIWTFWEGLLNEAQRRNTGVKKIIESLLNLYCLKYKSSSKIKENCLFIMLFTLLTENPNLQTKIINNNDKIENLKNKINIIYGEIKKSEIKEKSNYLFNNSITKAKNLEKSLNKLNKFDNVMFIPRK